MVKRSALTCHDCGYKAPNTLGELYWHRIYLHSDRYVSSKDSPAPLTVTVNNPPVVQKPRTSKLSRHIVELMDGKRDSWEGTASALMAILDPSGGPSYSMPINATRLSKEIMTPKVTVALEASGITAARLYRYG